MSTPLTTAPAAPTILDFRLTFLWVETILDMISGATDLAEPFTFLNKSNRYRKVFEEVLAGKSKTSPEAPWQKRKKQFFWKYYLAGPALDSVSGRQAWEHLVPLRTKLPFAVKDWEHGRVTIEGFYYPHGLALAVTLRVVSALTLDQTVKLAYAIRDGDEKFSIQQDRLQTVKTLESLADDALTWMRDSLGKGVKPGTRRDVFSIFTVVKAVPMILFEPGGEVHRAFQAVTEWSSAPETASLRPILEVQVPVKGSDAPGTMLLAHRRGRAVWFPGLFSKNKPKKPSLSCYHRNLVFACMQVDSLGGLVRGMLRLLEDTPLAKVNSTLKTCALNTIDRLDELYMGDRDRTYRSASVAKQIYQNELKELNRLRRLMRPGQKDLLPLAEAVAQASPPPKG